MLGRKKIHERVMLLQSQNQELQQVLTEIREELEIQEQLIFADLEKVKDNDLRLLTRAAALEKLQLIAQLQAILDN